MLQRIDNSLDLINVYYQALDKSTSINPASGKLETDRDFTSQLSKLFAPDAVYERTGWEPIKGRATIETFLEQQRSLVGEHRNSSIDIKSGVPLKLAKAFEAQFPGINADECKTITVLGTFSGARCYNDKHVNRLVSSAAGIRLNYTDQWVMKDGAVIYRHSQISPEKHVGAERY